MRRTFAGGPGPRYLLLGATIFLVLAGLVMVYSASSVADYVHLDDSAYHLKRQVIWIAAGAVFMVLAMRLDYRRLRSAVWPFYLACVAGLVVVLVAGVGKWGATRWIDVGGFTIQPSEYAKLACVMLAAYLLVQLRTRAIRQKEFWGRLALGCGVVALLVMLQPDMGTTMSILIAVFLVLVLGGVNVGILTGTVVGGGLLAAVAIFAEPYRAQRFFAFMDPWNNPQASGYQSIQGLLAFGSGGVDGVGLGMSRQKFFYLPAAHTDFIYAIVGEEAGLIGTLAVLAAFVVFTYAGIRIALGAKDEFGRLLAGGVTAMIAVQAIMNMAAVTGLMPVTGIPMPLVSFGGNSMIFTMACIGIVLSVSRYGACGVRPVKQGQRREEKPGARDDERRRDRRPHLSGIDGGRGAARRRA